MSDFIRKCPECGKELTYKNKISLIRSTKSNSKCRSCTIRAMSDETKEKISKKQKGIARGRPSEQHRKNISKARGGSGNLDQKYPGWGSWRKRALDRVPFCEWCYSEDNLQVHHIMSKAKFPMYHDEDWNARVMCKQCHITCHKQGGY